MKRKFVSIMLCASMILGFAACGSSSNNTAETTKAAKTESSAVSSQADMDPEEEKASYYGEHPEWISELFEIDESKKDEYANLTFGCTFNSSNLDTYASVCYETFAKRCDEYGIKHIELDANTDAPTQVTQIQSLVDQGVDVLFTLASDGSALISGYKAAHEAGIPVINFTSPVDDDCKEYLLAYVGASNETEGALAAEQVMKGIEENGVALEDAKVIFCNGTAGYYQNEVRFEESRKILEAAGVEIIADEYTDWNKEKAKSLMETWLVQYGQIDGVIACNSNAGLGCIEAIEDAGREDEIVVVAGNVWAAGWEAIRDGRMYAGNKQDAVFETSLAVDIGVQYMLGNEDLFKNEDGSTRIDFIIDTPPMTQNTVELYECPVY